jgi:diguanylate cyclase (GGDEF)-like protein
MTGRPKLLCVDDEPFIIQALERLFKEHFEVLTTISPLEALEMIKKHPDCAAVVSDYRMPEMNGVELLKKVREIAPLCARTILSGQIDLHQLSDAINHADIHKFIMKPWENEYLTLQILETIQMHNTLREKAHYQQLAITDPVTQLTNHRFFQDQLRMELARAQSSGTNLTLVIFDVDHFKNFNDRFGHPEGDRLLYRVATQLNAYAQTKGFASRYGGEEFTLILPGMATASGLAVADDIRKAFERAPMSGPSSSPAYITLSAGLASYPEHAHDAPMLIESADRALYQAKRQGRNQVAVASSTRKST